MRQQTLAVAADGSFEKYRKPTRREVFLAEMDRIVPWAQLVALVEPQYPKAGNGRRPVGVERMLRIYFLQQWFNLSDPGWKNRCMNRPRCGSLWASIWARSQCRMRPRFAASAICWSSTSWARPCWTR